MKTPLNGIILFNDPYPIGQAGTNRIQTIAKGFLENGINVEIFILRPTERLENIINYRISGIFEGVKFKYLSNTNVKSSVKIINGIKHNILRLKLYYLLFKLRNKINFLIYPLDSFSTLILCRLALLFSQVKIIKLVDEYPPFVLNPKNYNTFYTFLNQNLFFKLPDSVVTITKKLEEYYKPFCKRSTVFLHLPMTVDLERFKIRNSDIEDAIIYCGNLGTNNKDGVDDLILAFNLIKEKYPELILRIIGSANETSEINNLYRIVKECDLAERVDFTGYIQSDKIPLLLSKAKLLALARPNNKQAEGGFPSKLGEYLATGIPVVVTNVGEITMYLEDNVSAYISEPSNYFDFAKKMDEVLSNYPKAIEVGRNGRNIAEKYFNYKQQGVILTNHIKNLLYEIQ